MLIIEPAKAKQIVLAHLTESLNSPQQNSGLIGYNRDLVSLHLWVLFPSMLVAQRNKVGSSS